MANNYRDLVYWPDSILKRVSEHLSESPDPELIKHMVQTMRKHKGAAIAAVQVGVLQRVLVVEDGYEGLVFVNPKIEALAGFPQKMAEGCLSIPGIVELIPRYTEVTLSYQNEKMEQLQGVVFTGQIAHAIQHEIDHLDGIVYPDLLPPGKRSTIYSQASKTKKELERIRRKTK